MSRAFDSLQMREEDVLKFLAARTHLGDTNLDFQVEQDIYKRKNDGIHIINLKRTWERFLQAAHAIVPIENPANVSVLSSRNREESYILYDSIFYTLSVLSSGNTCQLAVLKFAAATGATCVAVHFIPGTFTNQIQAAFCELTSDGY